MSFPADVERSITIGFTLVANNLGAGLLGMFRPVFIIGFSAL